MPRRHETVPLSDVSPPPEPPQVARSPRLYPYQWVGIPILALIVLLAMLGVFGDSQAEASGRGPSLGLRVIYPTKFRYKEFAPIRVWVTNNSPSRIDTIKVAFDDHYLNQFSNVTVIPSASEAYSVPLTGVEPGETRLVNVGLQAERYGSHSGTVSVSTGATGSTGVRISTFVFP